MWNWHVAGSYNCLYVFAPAKMKQTCLTFGSAKPKLRPREKAKTWGVKFIIIWHNKVNSGFNLSPLAEKSSIKGYSFHRWRGWWSKYRPTFLEKRGRHKPWSHHTSPNSSPPQSGSKWHIPTNKGYSVRPHRAFENPDNTKISTVLESTPSPRMELMETLAVSIENIKKNPTQQTTEQRKCEEGLCSKWEITPSSVFLKMMAESKWLS